MFASFISDRQGSLTAAITVAVTFVLIFTVERIFNKRSRQVAEAILRGELNAVAKTRLRLLERLAIASIAVVGTALALSQFSSLERLATGILASSAILAAVVGFGARQVLANAVAGVMIAITQPVRIGDRICFDGHEGVVEDVRLSYTVLITDEGDRVLIPNEALSSGTVVNRTL